MRVAVYIPNRAEYPFQAITRGIESLGHSIVAPSHDSADWLVVWTPWLGTSRDSLMTAFGPQRTIVVENGWLSPIRGIPYYQLAIGGWNGRGLFPIGNGERYRSWEVFRAQVRTCSLGERRGILVLGQNGHSIDDRTAPRNWAYDAVRVLERYYGPDNVRLRLKRGEAPLLEDLDRATDVVTHSSNAANWALLKGVNVYSASPAFIFRDISEHWDGVGPLLPQGRQCAPHIWFERAAWCQWNEQEIRSGEPFARLFAA